MKRTPLKRGTSQLKRTPLKRGDSQLKRTPLKQGESTLKRTPLKQGESTLERKPLKQVSEKRKEVNKQRKEAMIAHFGKRELWKCQIGDVIGTTCFGAVNGHEILSRARAGRTDANLLDMSGILLACNHHNSWIEDNPTKAHELGLTKHAWEA